ncbi:triacylglycerol lipase OBL1-like isoform X1 [Dioscorea cayenensis subsp. rotundata]|uniref:Triacylglycerol lipase OBL1-like isoform X1 n=1 Tax=Dioscorea cayennensis subsp. rotundata TaxID=55577 RepID=A0AB40BDH2_DIOCR|nr:triacylglycerol lipase OBL1-like isoform X1 [Dioscorea cayenensis subsp. rotundata]
MVSKGFSDEYLIFHHEMIGFLDILSLIFLRRKLTSYKFVEASNATSLKFNNVRADWVSALILLLQKFLGFIKKPLKFTGIAVEYLLNLVSINGGIWSLIKNLATFSVKWPTPNSKEYRSFIGHIDGRTELHRSVPVSIYFQLADPEIGLNEDINHTDLFAMAAKLAYENEAYIREVVTESWKMNFVAYFDCWNESLQAKTTQAFMFTDKLLNTPLIIIAFRGTQPFDADDWSTDIDLSFLSLGKMGNVHAGFLHALGFKSSPTKRSTELEDQTQDLVRPLAYNTIRDSLKAQLLVHQNAKIIITGHSLGGALAVLFPALLEYNQETTLLNSMQAVFTFGQPRVGDETFAKYMESTAWLNYNRMVYRFDIVPRIPPDYSPISLFKHFGNCYYYDGWYKFEKMEDVPNPNYLDLTFWPTMYANAWGDLIKGTQMGKTHGEEYKEGFVSIMFRAFGLIIPGVASHSPRDYVNAARLGQTSYNKL